MNTDERFDRELRDALGWRAERDARRSASLEVASRAVARRLGSGPTITSPLLDVTHTSRGMRLLVAAILIVLLTTAILAVGSRLLTPPRNPVQPGPLGFARDCGPRLSANATLQYEAAGSSTTLYAGGLLVTDRSTRGTTRTSIVTGAAFDVRRLSDRGRDLVVERVASLGLTRGCRTIQTSGISGSVKIRLADGVAQLVWGPDAVAQPGPVVQDALTGRSERVAVLDEALASLDAWLPADAWSERDVRRVAPNSWLITIGALPTDYKPGDGLDLPDGPFIDGSDPRYFAVELPGGVEPLEFGEEQPVQGWIGEGSIQRCGTLDSTAALALAESLDAMQLGADGYGDLFTDDLAWAVGIEMRPIDPGGLDCAADTATILAAQRGPPPGPEPTGDLGDVDPCTLVSSTVLDRLGGTAFSPVRSRLALGTPARACAVTRAEEQGIAPRLATLSLYPSTVHESDAAILAAEALAGVAETRPTGDGVAWANACLTTVRAPCTRIVAAWSRGTFIAIEFELFHVDVPNVTFDEAIAAAAAVFEELEHR